MPTLLILKGLPGSGKSTYASSLLKKGGNWKRVSKDALRTMLDENDFNVHNEDLLNTWAQQTALFYLGNDFDIVYDNMNLNLFILNRFLDRARASIDFLTIEIKDFNITLEECIKRDSYREKPVGSEIITEIHDRWLK